LAAAGFTASDLEITRRYTVADLPASTAGWATGLGEVARAELVERFASTFVRATKPVAAS
jgi:arsenite methyltransferase